MKSKVHARRPLLRHESHSGQRGELGPGISRSRPYPQGGADRILRDAGAAALVPGGDVVLIQ